MRSTCQPGDTRTYQITVRKEDTATFADTVHLSGGGTIHPFYATFALARDAEWACRLFVLDLKEDHEEGIGTRVSVWHRSPAQVGAIVTFTATLIKLERNNVLCHYSAHVGDRLIAEGEQEQKILTKDRIQRLINETIHG